MPRKDIKDERKNVGLWIRVSTEDQAKGESPEHHEARGRMYADSRGWQVVEVYNLAGVSGKSVMEHPEAKRMLVDIRSGHISALIFSKLARLARNTRELLDFSDIFREAGADLISLQESIDTSTPAGRLFYTVLAAMATWEREEIGSRVAASVPVRAKLGKPLGGVAPFGYRYVDRKLVPDPKEAPIRRRIHELFAEHRRKKTVARLLNEEGYRSRSGAKFADSTIDVLLRDPVVTGRRRMNHTTVVGGKGIKKKPESEWVWQEVEPIISEDLWRECVAILDDAKNRRKPAKKTATLFGGLVHCHCGEKMYVPSNTPKYVCRTCRTKIPMTDLEGIFKEQLKGFFFSTEDIARHLDHADEEIREKSALLESLSHEGEKLRAETEKLYQLYLSGNLSAAAFGERNRPLEEREGQIRDSLPRLQGEIDFLKINRLSSDEIVDEAQRLYSGWMDLSFEEKRRVVENVTEGITIGKDNISLQLFHLPSSQPASPQTHGKRANNPSS